MSANTHVTVTHSHDVPQALSPAMAQPRWHGALLQGLLRFTYVEIFYICPQKSPGPHCKYFSRLKLAHFLRILKHENK